MLGISGPSLAQCPVGRTYQARAEIPDPAHIPAWKT